jgi:hypothetical protein
MCSSLGVVPRLHSHVPSSWCARRRLRRPPRSQRLWRHFFPCQCPPHQRRGAAGIRTPDLRRARAALSRLSYGPSSVSWAPPTCGRAWTRTRDLGLIRAALSPPELRARRCCGSSTPARSRDTVPKTKQTRIASPTVHRLSTIAPASLPGTLRAPHARRPGTGARCHRFAKPMLDLRVFP